MLTSSELEKMGTAIKVIGAAKACITGQIIAETKKNVLANGLDAAELYASHLTGTDENTELSHVLDKLTIIGSGKW